MKFAPGTDPKKAQEALIAAGYPAPRTPGATNSALPTVGPGALPPSSPDSPATPVPTKPPRRGGKNRRQAGMNFGLMPTEVIEQVRGRGYGLTYQPQQRTGKQIKFGGGGPQNVINFNPIMSQQANPNIRVGVEGARATQTANPQLTSSPIQESGPGSVYTGPNTGNFEEGPGDQIKPNTEVTTPPKGEQEPVKTTEPKPETDKPENNYQKRMNRYMRKYDRTAYGAGSSRGTDRFSAKDIRKMFRAGRKFGGTKKQAARDVLAYARRNRKKTKMGGTAKRQLAKLQQMLGRRRKEEKKRKSMTAKQQRKLDRKQRRRAKRKVRKYNKARRARRNKRRGKKNRR